MKTLSLLLASIVAAMSPIVAQVTSQADPAPGSMAHFRFDGDGKDAHAGNRPFVLKNTEFREDALYLNGKYEWGAEKGGYQAVCVTPKLDYNHFTVALNGQKALEWDDETFMDAGKVGVWTKADSVTLFDDLTRVGKSRRALSKCS